MRTGRLVELRSIGVDQGICNGSVAMSRHHLRYLVEKIVVTDHHVRIEVRGAAALKMMAAGGGAGATVNRQGLVLTSVVEWLPIRSAARTKFSARPKRFNSFSG